MQDDEEDLPDADSEPEDEPDDEKRKKQALAEKDKGNAAYKAKRFDEAIEHYDAAYDLYDQDISFITNRSASWRATDRKCMGGAAAHTKHFPA